jgi:hypothetical protein
MNALSYTPEYANAVLVFVLVVGLDPSQAVSVWTTGYATISAVYLNCFIFVLCAICNGQSVLHHPSSMRTLIFQIIHGHLGCVCVLKTFAIDKKSAIFLSNVVIMQSHLSLASGAQFFRKKFPVNPEWIFRISAFFVFTGIHHLLGVNPFAHFESVSYSKLLSTQYPAIMFIAPAAIHCASMLLTAVCDFVLIHE